MKRRKQPFVGRASFLPTLPAGDLNEWLRKHHSKSVGIPVPSVLGSTTSDPLRSLKPDIPENKRKRPDMPLVRNCSSDRRNDFSFIDDPAMASAALDDFKRDYHAASSRKPRDALLATWFKFHEKWFGPSVPPLPVTEHSLECVSCLFKHGGYKSFKNYVSRIKEVHVESGFIWGQNLQFASKRCVRSVLRGLGGPSRSEAFDLDKVSEYLTHRNHTTAVDGPMSPLAAVVVGTYFLLRELELSSIDLDDVSFTDDSCTLSLPVSKVDWQAKGCRRTWTCICQLSHPCPVHILKLYDDARRSMKTCERAWIISNSGTRCTKHGIVTMIREAVHLSGGQSKAADGTWQISGHTFRITGARTLSVWGLDPITIQLIGRWGSSAVLSK